MYVTDKLILPSGWNCSGWQRWRWERLKNEQLHLRHCRRECPIKLTCSTCFLKFSTPWQLKQHAKSHIVEPRDVGDATVDGCREVAGTRQEHFPLPQIEGGLPLRPYAWLKEAQPCQFTNSLLLNLKPQPWSTCTLTCRFNFDTQQISKFCLFCIQSSWSSSSLACLVWFFTGFILTRGYETLPQFVEDLAPQL